VRKIIFNQKIIAWGLLIILSCIWGSSYILIKKALCFFSPHEIVYIRILSAALFLLPYALKSLKKLNRKTYSLLGIIGLLGTFVPLLCFSKAQMHINSGIHGVLNSLTPVFVLLIGIILFKRKILKNEILGIVLGITGTVVLMVVESSHFEGTFNYYILLSLLGSCLYGNTTNIIKYYLNDVKSTTIVSVSLLLIAIPISIYCFFYMMPLLLKVRQINHFFKPLLYSIFAGIFNLGLANIILAELVKRTSPVFTSTEALLAPIVALSWGLADGENILWAHYIGAATTLLGVYFINRATPIKTH